MAKAAGMEQKRSGGDDDDEMAADEKAESGWEDEPEAQMDIDGEGEKLIGFLLFRSRCAAELERRNGVIVWRTLYAYLIRLFFSCIATGPSW